MISPSQSRPSQVKSSMIASTCSARERPGSISSMRAFSQLLDDLVYTRSRNTKLKLIGDYLKETPDPDRGSRSPR
jgi:hypothetical protein